MSELTVSETLELAIQQHQAGRLSHAEILYREILAQEPEHPEALNLMGVLAYQRGQHELAVTLINRAIAADRSSANFQNNLGLALTALGRLDEGIAALRLAVQTDANLAEAYNNLGNALLQKKELEQAHAALEMAISLRPDFAEAHNNLGNVLREQMLADRAVAAYRSAIQHNPSFAEAYDNLGAVLKELGELDSAIAAIQTAVRLRPDWAEAHLNLANRLRDANRINEAIETYLKAIQLKPGLATARINLGGVLRSLGRAEQAVAVLKQAIVLKPDSATAHNNLGNALKDLHRLDEAIAAFRAAADLRPSQPQFKLNLASALHARGSLDESVEAYREVLWLMPDDPDVLNDLGNVLLEAGRQDEAVSAYHSAIQARPDSAGTYNNLGTALELGGQFDQAMQAYQSALQLRPDSADVYNNLGGLHKWRGELDEALECYRRAMELKPDWPVPHSNLLYAMYFCPQFDSRAIHEAHQAWNERFARPLASLIQPHRNDRSPDRPLRVGFVSPNFSEHPVGIFMVPLLEQRDPRQVQTICLSDVLATKPSKITQRLRAAADGWHDVVGLSDDQLAQLIREQQIDILIDLALHMANNRMLTFARKPAPVQATWVGVPGTTGLETMDYRISDRFLDPPGLNDEFYVEKMVRLEGPYWCYTPPDESELAVNPLPALESQAITFGCLNNFSKVNDRVLDLWAQVLGAVPNSRLLVLTDAGSHRDRTADVFTRAGVEPSRVEFVPKQPRLEYFKLHYRIDIALDTFPYNGHTTSMDAFWMGVPVVSLVGQTAVSRAGLTLANHLGLPELAVEAPHAYVECARKLAGDLPRLQQLRATLRERMKSSPLMDPVQFARNMEVAYRTMWHNWCAS